MNKDIFKDKDTLLRFIDDCFTDQTDTTRLMSERIIWRNLLYYCMAEGTEVPLLDGTTVPIESLVGKEPVWVYGFDLDRLKIVPAKLENCHQTGEKECVEIVLDNGNSFICTKDHRILTWFGYREAQDLKAGMPLVPFRSKFFMATGTSGGYNQIFQPYDAKWIQTHRAVYDALYGIYDKRHVIHHVNDNKTDNRPENLQLMSAREHSTLTLIKHKDKIIDGLNRYCKTEISSKRKRASAKRQWATQRERMLEVTRKSLNKSYDKRVAGIKEYWANAENRRHEIDRRLGNRWAEKGAAINCRVVEIKSVGIKKVYDATVPETSNFAIGAGVFVHNCGEQYIEYVRSTNTFRRRTTPDYVPTPVSNKIREYVRSIKAMLMNQKMVPRVWPNTNEKADIEAADLGETVLVWMDHAHDGKFFDEKEKVCIWLPISGTAFMRTFPNADGGLWIPGGGKTGDVDDECILPFNVRLDTMGDTLKKKRWVGIQSLKDKEWVEDTFHVKITTTDQNKTQIDYQRRLAKLMGSVSPWKGQVIDLQTLDSQEDDQVLFKEIEFAPNRNYPGGRYCISAGGQLLKTYDRLPIPATADWWDYSLTDFHWNYMPGRFWSEPGINDLISPQNIINEIDQALAINRKGLGRPKVIVAGEIGLGLIDSGGHGFVALKYNPIMGQRPEFKEGTPLPSQVLDERMAQEAVFQEASGDPKNILKGQQPSANASGILTENLRETAEQGRYPDLDRFNRSLTRVYKKRLMLAQELYTEERLVKVAGIGNRPKIVKFKAADLRGNTDVRLELDSGLISTKSGQAQMMLDMITSGFFKEGDDAISPTTRQEVLQRLGISTFSDEINSDVERAEQENVAVCSGESNVMTTAPDPKTGEDVIVTDDPLFRLDDHKAHHATHRKFILSPEFRELPMECQVVLIKHDEAHEKAIAEQPPDIREYVQIDKILVPGVLKESERAQVVQKYLGIQPGDEPMLGLPSADTVVKAKTKLQDTETREEGKAKQQGIDFIKHSMSEAVKADAVQVKKEGQGVGRSKPQPSKRV